MSDEHGRVLLASLLDDVVADQDDAVRRAELDFADVVARAQRHDPGRPARLLGEAQRLAAMREDQLVGAARIGDLDALVEATRARLVLVGAASERVGLPPLRFDTAHGRHRGVWTAAISIAALFVAALSLGWGLTADTLERADLDDYAGANQVADEGEWSEARIDDTPRPEPRPRTQGPATPVLAAVPPPPAPAKARVAPRPSVGDRLVAIDARGRDAWKRGELAAAEAAFTELVRVGGRRPIVDIAYGDLFELARQRRDPAKEARLWRAYLKRFPHGRYADEARAGVCRRAQGDAARECWRSYLADRPNGTYRDRARAALGIAGAAPTPAR
jgi:hypothetical protein